MMVLANLTEAQLSIAQENASAALSDMFLNPPTVSNLDLGLPSFGRKKRQAAPQVLSFDDQVILVALQNENACNPVLKASANSIIETVER